MRLPLLSLSLISLPLLAFASMEGQLVFSYLDPDPQLDIPIQFHAKPTLADLLTIEPSASIFYSYARQLELSSMFSKNMGEGGMMLTLLVPTDKAVMALARKPNQGPEPLEPEIEISEDEFESVSKKNVERWVSAHIIPRSPIDLVSRTYDTLLSGKSVSFQALEGGDESKPEWTRVLVEGDSSIVSMKEASNGVLYIVDGTIKAD